MGWVSAWGDKELGRIGGAVPALMGGTIIVSATGAALQAGTVISSGLGGLTVDANNALWWGAVVGLAGRF